MLESISKRSRNRSRGLIGAILATGGVDYTEYLSSEGRVLLDVPRIYGDGPLPLTGDQFIDTTDANKEVTSKMIHNDWWHPRFTTDPGVSIVIIDKEGNERAYDVLDPLPEYQPAVNNEIYFIRDYGDSGTTTIYILIIQ